MSIYLDDSQSIGNALLIQINRLISGLRVRLLAKIEGRNPAYRVKFWIGAAVCFKTFSHLHNLIPLDPLASIQQNA